MLRHAVSTLCLMACAVLLGCATHPAEAPPVISEKPIGSDAVFERRKMMVGTWLEEAPTVDGDFRRELATRSANGTYRIVFRIYGKDGAYRDQIEVGEWGISGDVYFTITKGVTEDGEYTAADLTDPYYYDAYTIIKLSSDEFEYKHVEVLDTFIAKRVSADYKLPDTAPPGNREQ